MHAPALFIRSKIRRLGPSMVGEEYNALLHAQTYIVHYLSQGGGKTTFLRTKSLIEGEGARGVLNFSMKFSDRFFSFWKHPEILYNI